MKTFILTKIKPIIESIMSKHKNGKRKYLKMNIKYIMHTMLLLKQGIHSFITGTDSLLHC